ncbi:MAG: YdbC family protein [Bdellovibrionaceae bacterium]|nr:YdbC family protein [Pseudobdellovibrionaceae bacterium]
MLIKWIVCNVEHIDRPSFSSAQEKWNSIARSPGFLAQLGGWDQKNLGEACILSLWRDQKSFDRFMNQVHDSVTESNSQVNTYTSIAVDYFKLNAEMPGKFKNLIEASREGRFLRVAVCNVKSERIDHFQRSQSDVWMPGMQQSVGMLGGSFNQSIRQENRFLVTTLWDNSKNHQRYVEEKLPLFRERADISTDLDAIVGRFIELEPNWLVLPTDDNPSFVI